MFKLAQEDKAKRGDKAISINLFDKVSQLEMCKNMGDQAVALNHCLNEHIVNRKVHEVLKAKGGKNNYNRQRTQNNKRDDDDRKGNNYKKDNWQKDEPEGSWKMQDTTEKAKLKEKARAMHEKVMTEKNVAQQIRLILNVITPDNYDKKF